MPVELTICAILLFGDNPGGILGRYRRTLAFGFIAVVLFTFFAFLVGIASARKWLVGALVCALVCATGLALVRGTTFLLIASLWVITVYSSWLLSKSDRSTRSAGLPDDPRKWQTYKW